MTKSVFELPDKIFGLEKSLLMLFLLPLGLILLFFVSLNLVLMPKVNEIGGVNKKINEINTNTDNLNKQINYLKSVDPEQLQQDSDYLDNAVLRDKRSYLLVGIIREVASKFDYQVKSFSLVPGELKADGSNNTASLENMVRMSVELSMSGPKNRSLELIIALEKTLPILFIDKFKTETTGDILKLDLIVYSYYISNEANVDTGNIALNDLILTGEESALVKKISSFTKIEENQSGVGTSEFQQYTRENPFSL